MPSLDLAVLGDKVTRLIKQATWFPYKTGKLKFEATSGQLWDINTYRIKFDSSVAPYVVYLEEGTDPHDIYPKTRKFLKFEVNGRTIFARKVHHPGSKKHVGFIKDKSVNAIVNYIASVYGGVVEEV